MTLRQKLVGTQIVTMFAALIGMAGYYQYRSAAAEQELVDKLTATAQLLGQNSSSAVLFTDPVVATEVLASLQVDGYVMNACIYDMAGAVFAFYCRQDCADYSFPDVKSPGSILSENQIEVTHSLVFQGEVIGVVYLRSDLSWLESRRHEILQQTAVLLIVGGAFSLILLLLLQRSISGPLRRLSEASARVAEDGDHTQVERGWHRRTDNAGRRL